MADRLRPVPGLDVFLRLHRSRRGRWVFGAASRTTPRRRVVEAWALVSTCWFLRGVAFFLLLGTLDIGFSIPRALLFLCAGAAAAAIPVGIAGAATQVGAGAAALVTAGVGLSQALAATVAVGALGVMSGTAILVGAVVWRVGVSLVPARPA